MNYDSTIAKGEADEWLVKIGLDTDPLDPREGGGNYSTIVDWHKDYSFGEEKLERGVYANEYEALIKHLPKPIEEYFYLPIYLLDHSGLRLSTTSFACDPGGWDSGQVGWIYIHKDDFLELSTEKSAEEYLKGEIEMMDMFCAGDVYAYSIERKTTCSKCGHTKYDRVEFVGNWYGYDFVKYGIIDSIESTLRITYEVSEEVIEVILKQLKEDM